MKRFRLRPPTGGFPISRHLLLTAHRLLLTGLLALAALASSCGGDGKDKVEDVAGNDSDTTLSYRVAGDMKATVTTRAWTVKDGKETETQNFTVSQTKGSCSVDQSGGRYRMVIDFTGLNVEVPEGSYHGPGSYNIETRDIQLVYEVCTLVVDEGERSGTFACKHCDGTPTPTGCTGSGGKTYSGRYECGGDWTQAYVW